MTELLALYDVTSFSYPQTANGLLAELVEKTSRLFGALRVALALPERNGEQAVLTWGFKDSDEVQSCLNRAGDHCLVYDFQPKSRLFVHRM